MGALTRVRMAAVYTIYPQPPLYNPNAFPEFTECESSPLKEDGIRIDSHNSGVAWPVDIWPILNPHGPATRQTRKRPENETNVGRDSSQFKRGRNVALERGINPPQSDGGSDGEVSVKCVGRSEKGL